MIHEIDNVPVYDDYVYFDDWLKVFYGKTWEVIYDDLCCEGLSDEEIEDYEDTLYDEFCEWASEYNLCPQRW